VTPAPRVLPRRTVLAVSGTAVLAAAAACSAESAAPASSSAAATSSSASSAASSPASPSAAANVPATSATAPPAADPSTPAATSAAEPAAPTGTPLAAVADVESAGSLIVNGADGPVLLASANGSVVGHSAVCTHQQCTIAASGSCPCHGSKFNITTGAVENGPAQRPLDEIAVTVAGGQVYPS